MQAPLVFLLPSIALVILHAQPAASFPTIQSDPSALRQKLVATGGGNTESETMVARGLAWLAKQQQAAGSWAFDGRSKDQIAATGMALLPLLVDTEYTTDSSKYAKVIKSGTDWLAARVEKDGKFTGSGTMYSQAIGTMALCEAARITKDDKLKDKAAIAVDYIVRSQGNNGSWGYTGGKPTDGDTSIVGWQIQALASAKRAEIKFDTDKVFKNANKFLESVSTDNGSNYGYREKGSSQTLTPVGLLSRYYMKELSPRHPALERGVDFLKLFPPQKGYFDMYYYYYSTQVVHFYGGPDWHKYWNPKMRDMLCDMQNKGGDENRRGSWDKDQGFIGAECGRLGTTALAILTLEIYYRSPPLYKRDAGGLAELEK